MAQLHTDGPPAIYGFFSSFADGKIALSISNCFFFLGWDLLFDEKLELCALSRGQKKNPYAWFLKKIIYIGRNLLL